MAELEELVIAHPMREPLAARLMRALYASGRRGAALEVYEQTRKRLADRLGADPSAELAALHLELLADPPEHPPHTNLRAELTSFVGRDAELAQVAGLLGAHRLITLTGPGGAGKTRLAVEAARAELSEMPDGVWLVELAPVTDPAEVTSAALAALGLREKALLYARGPLGAPADEQADTLGRLLAALAGQRALLVLDNCEHLVTAVARLADRVLAACPQVRIMATSREPLNITGEALWTVGPLTLPPDPAVSSFDSAERSGLPAPATVTSLDASAAVRLLAQRARAVSPGFEVTAANAPAVARICRALDGMPLAIELAAARMRTMAPEQVAARLDDRFGLLTGGSRIAMPRHQTLRAVVDWSWDLLDGAERALWRRFSVFAGGATLEAAEQVCAGGAASGSTRQPGPRPADRARGQVTADRAARTRRRPGTRCWRSSGPTAGSGWPRRGSGTELREAHARYFTRLAEASQYHLLSARQLDWLRRLADDQDNLHAAIRGTVAAGDAETAVRLAAALGWYWSLRTMKVEGAELIGEAVGVPGAAEIADTERLAVAYAMGGLLCADTPWHDTGAGWFRRAAELAAGIPAPVSPIMPLIGPLSHLFGAYEGPVDAEIFDHAVGHPDPWVSAIARILRAHTVLNLGRRHAQAEADFLAAIGMLAAHRGTVGPGGRARRPGHAGELAGRARRRGRSLPAGHRFRRRVWQHGRRGAVPPVHGARAPAARQARGGPGRTRRRRGPTPSGSACPNSSPSPLTRPATWPAWTASPRSPGTPWPGPSSWPASRPGISRFAPWPPPGSVSWPALRVTSTRPATGTPRR